MGGGEGKQRMIENVVSVKAKLRFVAFRYAEGLRECHIRVEPTRTAVGMPSDIADLAASRQRKPSGCRPRDQALVILTGDVRRGILDFWKRLAQSSTRQRREPEQEAVGISARSRLKSAGANRVGTAWPGIGNLAALSKAGRPGQTATVVERVRNLPAANKQVGDAAHATHERLALADRQLVHRVDHEYVLAVEADRTLAQFLIRGEIAGAVEISPGGGIVRQALQTLAD